MLLGLLLLGAYKEKVKYHEETATGKDKNTCVLLTNFLVIIGNRRKCGTSAAQGKTASIFQILLVIPVKIAGRATVES
jgi:hypothetical protein